MEFVRLTGAHLGFIAFEWVTMGHLLTLPMLLGGAALIVWSRSQPVASVKGA
ncbi:hypothetical protein [Halomonas sp. 7T]|uniref:hypothetical protein n=1 Tax=Halomonas sp. 7T TaxID=2893469 RepID=UPI003987EF7A